MISNRKINIKRFGNYDLKVFKNKLDGAEHYAITSKNFSYRKSPRVRVISTNIINTIFNFKKNIFKSTLNYLSKFNNFALIIVKSPSHTKNSKENSKILRYYGVGAQIIKELKIKDMILVSRSKSV